MVAVENECPGEEGTRPGGSFMLMSPGVFRRGFGVDRHQVFLTRPFYIGVHPVTQAQWMEVMGKNPSHFRGDDLPVDSVSWDDCQEFIAALNSRDSGTRRLPTEAEWEYACKAGSAFGEARRDMAWFGEDYLTGGTHPVCSKEPNDWGLYDMQGNVWEWCQDRFGDHGPGPETDPCGPLDGLTRVVRGGSWDREAWRCSAEHRSCRSPETRNFVTGFRLAMDPAPGFEMPADYNPGCVISPRGNPVPRFPMKKNLTRLVMYLFCHGNGLSGLFLEAAMKDFLIRHYGHSGREVDAAMTMARAAMEQPPDELEIAVLAVTGDIKRFGRRGICPEPGDLADAIREAGLLARVPDDLESRITDIFLYSIHLSRSDACYTIPWEVDLLTGREWDVWEEYPGEGCSMRDW